MKRNGIALVCAALLGALGACAPASPPAEPDPTPASSPAPLPWIFDYSSLREAHYELRQTAEHAARLRTAEDLPCETDAGEISLTSPLTFSMADAAANGLGTVTVLETEGDTLYLALCRGLTLSGDVWPELRTEESFSLPLTVEGGSLQAMTLSGGEITVRRAYLTGPIRLRGADVEFESCIFAPTASISAPEGARITVDGTPLAAGSLPPGLTGDRIFREESASPGAAALPRVIVDRTALVTLLPPAEPEPTPSPTAPSPEETIPPEPAEETPGRADDPEISRAEDNSVYYVRVNVQANAVTVYARDGAGNFTVPCMAMICSTGWDTPQSGVFRPGVRYRWQDLFGNVYGQYTTQITGNILFHSVPYLTSGDPGSLEYWEFDKLGTTCSMGCVRLQVADARWIYENAWQIGGIEFYADPDPGPLGRPAAPQIGWNESARGWDPTDTDSRNPWLNPTPAPTEAPTPEPTNSPAPEPADTPTPESTEAPTPVPTDTLTPEPTEAPAPEPPDTPAPAQADKPAPEPTEAQTSESTPTPAPEPADAPETP